MARSKTKQLSYIAVPSQVIHSLSSSSLQNLILSPKKSSRSRNRLFSLTISPRFFLSFLFIFALVGTLQIGFRLDPLLPFSPMPCSTIGQGTTAAAVVRTDDSRFPVTAAAGGVEWKEEDEFWRQPEGMGYRPCLEFSEEYRRQSEGVRADRRKYLLVVVSGGVNQQRNQIVDAVVIARILGAALVVPILQVNVIWGDQRYSHRRRNPDRCLNLE